MKRMLCFFLATALVAEPYPSDPPPVVVDPPSDEWKSWAAGAGALVIAGIGIWLVTISPGRNAP